MGLILLGVALRLKHFLTGCSLWTDEAWVAVDVTSRSLWEILTGFVLLPDFSRPPLGFLVGVKGCVFALGSHEFGLRFFSLICGISAIFLFRALTRRVLRPAQATFALFLFCFSPILIYYSAELKQYSTDLAMSLVLWMVFEQVFEKGMSVGRLVFLGAMGAVSVWVSNAALFMLAGFGLTMGLEALLRKKLRDLVLCAPAFLAWALSFLWLYRWSLSDMVSNESLFNTWKGAVLEGPVFSWGSVVWAKTVWVKMFEDLVQAARFLEMTDTAAFLVPVVGVLGLAFFVFGVARAWRDDRRRALMFLLPIVVTFLAAAAHKYPFRGRLLLFLVPAIYFFLAEGTRSIAERGKSWGLTLVVVLWALVLAVPLARSWEGLARDYCRQDNRQAMDHFRHNYQKGDVVFLNPAAQYPLWYYAKTFGMSYPFDYTDAGSYKGKILKTIKVGKFCGAVKQLLTTSYAVYRWEGNVYDATGAFRQCFEILPPGQEDMYNLIFKGNEFRHPLDGQRLWLFFSDPEPMLEEIASEAFRKRYKMLKEFHGQEVSLYLFDLKNRP